jgi:hypothetical protein
MSDNGRALDLAKARPKIRQRLHSGVLPKEFDADTLLMGTPPNGACIGCGETFSDDSDAVGHMLSGTAYWFHLECEKMWQEERHQS